MEKSGCDRPGVLPAPERTSTGRQAQLATCGDALADSQDSLKIQLGLPPNVQLDINENGLAPFEMISWDLIDLERRMRDLQKELGEQLLPDLGENQADTPPDFATLRAYVNGLAELRDELREDGINVVKNDLKPVRGPAGYHAGRLESQSSRSALLPQRRRTKSTGSRIFRRTRPRLNGRSGTSRLGPTNSTCCCDSLTSRLRTTS